MFKEIQIGYWYGNHEDKTNLAHNEKFPYSLEMREFLIENILHCNLNVLLLRSENTLIIYIDDKRFQQR